MPHHVLAQPSVADLKRKSVVGGVAAVSAQGAKFVVQTATMMVLARLLSPQDFGLQGMVLALTGFLGLFRDAGLGSATIQRHEVTNEQTSTLFWINVAIGAVLTILCAASAPLVVRFYHEPRLYWVVVVSGLAFLFNGLAAQHGALLQRGMRFVTQAKIDVLSLTVSSAVGVVMALLDCRYWSLVGMAMASSIVAAAALWIVVPWVPGRPRRRSGIRSMLHFGGLATCNSFVVFLAWNAEKILLGRFWGADALGLYGRAFQLVTLPVQQLNIAVTGVAFLRFREFNMIPSAWRDPSLKGYSVLISLTVPVTISCALFADEIVRIVLGEKWMEAAPIFRLLAPVALVFAVANPLSWLVMSTGRAGRALGISTATTPFIIVGILLGLSQGPMGVALGYSLAMILLIIPIAAWSKLGTEITWADLWRGSKPPFFSGLVAGAAGLLVKFTLGGKLTPIPYLLIGLAVVLGIYAWGLLIWMGQKHVYMDVLSQLLPRRETQQERTLDLPSNRDDGYKPNDRVVCGVLKPGNLKALWRSTPSRWWSSRELVVNSSMSHPILAKAVRLQVLGKSPAAFYLRLNKRIWERLPFGVRNFHLIRSYGAWLHTLVCVRARRQQVFGTFFLRNRPGLDLMRRLANQKPRGSTLRIAVLGCSIGAEVYSILWSIRSARPDLKVLLNAVDISKEILSFAEKGIYPADTALMVNASLFQRLTETEKAEMFDWEGDDAKVKSWLREGITWQLGDAADPELINALEPQDIVVASNFLCHMAPADAEKCLGNIARLVSPGGYLFVSGVDLDVRSKVAVDLGWEPVPDLIAEIHNGDPSVRADWPWEWWGLEPLNRKKQDWQTRYAAVFRIVDPLRQSVEIRAR